MKITVVIPTKDRPKLLWVCLDALLGQSDHDFDVLVVSDGEYEPTDLICQQASRKGLSLRHVRGRGSAGAAFNVGAQEAATDYIYFVDDDCFLDMYAVERMKMRLQPERISGGKIIYAGPSIFGRSSQMFTDFLIDYYEQVFLATSNFALHKETFNRVGPFAEISLCYDREWYWRVGKAGVETEYIANVMAFHNKDYGKTSLVSLLRQHFGYGRGSAWFYHVTGEPLMPFEFYIKELFWPITRKNLNLTDIFLFSNLFVLQRIAHTLGYLYENFHHHPLSVPYLASLRRGPSRAGLPPIPAPPPDGGRSRNRGFPR